MRIETNTLPLVFASLMGMTAADFEIKSFTDKETDKTTVKEAPNGKAVYRTPLAALKLDEETGKPTREDKSVTFGILEPCEVEAGKHYRAAGIIWVTPYITNANRMGISIIAERLEPVSAPVSFKRPAGD